jgi:hypothetical protein
MTDPSGETPKARMPPDAAACRRAPAARPPAAFQDHVRAARSEFEHQSIDAPLRRADFEQVRTASTSARGGIC